MLSSSAIVWNIAGERVAGDQSPADQFAERSAELVGQHSGRLQQVGGELEDGTIYGRDPERAQKLAERHEAIELELLEALERWEALEAKRAGTV